MNSEIKGVSRELENSLLKYSTFLLRFITSLNSYPQSSESPIGKNAFLMFQKSASAVQRRDGHDRVGAVAVRMELSCGYGSGCGTGGSGSGRAGSARRYDRVHISMFSFALHANCLIRSSSCIFNRQKLLYVPEFSVTENMAGPEYGGFCWRIFFFKV